MNYLKKSVPLILIFFIPTIVLAQGSITDLESLIGSLVRVANALVPLILSIGGIVFMWGVIKMIMHADNEKARTDGRNLMIWGIVGLAVMLSVWGLAKLLRNTFFPSIPLNPLGQVESVSHSFLS